MQTHYDAQASFHLATWSLMKTFTTQRKSDVLDAEGGFTLTVPVSVNRLNQEHRLLLLFFFSSISFTTGCTVATCSRGFIKFVSKGKSLKDVFKMEKLDSVLECQCLSWGSTDAGTQICSTNPLNTLSGENKARKMDMRKMKNDFLCLGELFLKNPLCLTSI